MKALHEKIKAARAKKKAETTKEKPERKAGPGPVKGNAQDLFGEGGMSAKGQTEETEGRGR